MYVSLASVLTNGALSEEGWYSAAEASLKALFALHPQPVALCTALLKKMGQATFQGLDGELLISKCYHTQVAEAVVLADTLHLY